MRAEEKSQMSAEEKSRKSFQTTSASTIENISSNGNESTPKKSKGRPKSATKSKSSTSLNSYQEKDDNKAVASTSKSFTTAGNTALDQSLEDDKEELFCWKTFLTANPNHNINNAPVSAFPHVPLCLRWNELEKSNVKVEFSLGKATGTGVGKKIQKFGEIFWIGVIEEFFGYMVKVRSEGYSDNYTGKVPTRWLNFITDCFRVGSCANKPDSSLIPPFELHRGTSDWRHMVLSEVAVGITIPKTVSDWIVRDTTPCVKVGTLVEALDNHCISRMKAGIVKVNIGKRLYVEYWDAKGDGVNDGNWYHENSCNVRPRGWSSTVGHEISAPKDYKFKVVPDNIIGKKLDDGITIDVGMKLEAIDSVNPSKICAATVRKVLKFGYMMVSFDGDEGDDGTSPEDEDSKKQRQDSETNPELKEEGHGNEWQCFHVTSTSIFYCGFCKENGIDLVPPKEYKDKPFEWEDYFATTGTAPLKIENVRPYNIDTKISVGMMLEAVDLIDQSLICVSSVVDAKGRLLKVNFEGWTEEFDQWMDAQCCELFPVGWCDAVNHPLQYPADKSKSFWRKFNKPDHKIKLGRTLMDSEEYKEINSNAKVIPGERRRGRPKSSAKSSCLIESSVKEKSRKRKASESLTDSSNDHHKVKAEAVMLVQKKVKVLPKSALEELRASVKTPTSISKKGKRQDEITTIDKKMKRTLLNSPSKSPAKKVVEATCESKEVKQADKSQSVNKIPPKTNFEPVDKFPTTIKDDPAKKIPTPIKVGPIERNFKVKETPANAKANYNEQKSSNNTKTKSLILPSNGKGREELPVKKRFLTKIPTTTKVKPIAEAEGSMTEKSPQLADLAKKQDAIVPPPAIIESNETKSTLTEVKSPLTLLPTEVKPEEMDAEFT